MSDYVATSDDPFSLLFIYLTLFLFIFVFIFILIYLFLGALHSHGDEYAYEDHGILDKIVVEVSIVKFMNILNH